MDNSLISIIVPIFNVETYISECIESIQNQTYQNLQIILVDDGSVDQSGIICDKYALKDLRIEVIHQHNQGVVAARKHGLDRAKGKYIGFVDGDDYIEPDMYQMLIQEMERSKADFVHSGFWESNKKIEFSNERIKVSEVRYKLLKDVILESYITPSNWSKLFKAHLIKRAYDQLDNDCSLGEDLLVLCVCILECNIISIVKDSYYHYRVREGSLSHKNEIGDLKKVYKLYENLSNVLGLYGLEKKFKPILDEFLWNNMMNYMARINQEGFQIAKYYFGDTEKLCGRKIVIYGAGTVGRDYYAQICRYSDCRVIAWIDSHPERYHYKHINLYGIAALDTIEFDMLLIAVLNKKLADDIRNELIKIGIGREKIYWSKPKKWGYTRYSAD